MTFMFDPTTGQFRTGKGRLVQGVPHKAQPVKDDDGKPVLNADGTPRTEVYIGVAFPKNDPDWLGLKAGMEAECKKEWAGKINFEHAAFSFKWRDADTSRDKAGQSLAEKNPATAGHDVLSVTRNGSWGLPQMYARAWLLPDGHPEKVTGQPGPLVHLDNATAEVLFKRGYYVRVFGDRKNNETPKYPGQYVNLEGIELFEYGEEIISQGSRPSGEDMFGDAAPAASAPTPSAPERSIQFGGEGTMTVADAPAPAPEPYTGYAEAPAPTGPTMLPKANGVTYDAFKAKGWTDEQLKKQGYMA